jgi:hypothetical protein
MEVAIYLAKFVCNYTAAFLLKMMIIDTFFVVSTSERSNICRNRSICTPKRPRRGRTFVLIVNENGNNVRPLGDRNILLANFLSKYLTSLRSPLQTAVQLRLC